LHVKPCLVLFWVSGCHVLKKTWICFHWSLKSLFKTQSCTAQPERYPWSRAVRQSFRGPLGQDYTQHTVARTDEMAPACPSAPLANWTFFILHSIQIRNLNHHFKRTSSFWNRL
jgi:hypothetical protein